MPSLTRRSWLVVLFLLACKPRVEIDEPTPAPTGAALKNGGSDLPDSGVVACTLRSFVKASFPAAAAATKVSAALAFTKKP